jgi:hypothetical protein
MRNLKRMGDATFIDLTPCIHALRPPKLWLGGTLPVFMNFVIGNTGEAAIKRI